MTIEKKKKTHTHTHNRSTALERIVIQYWGLRSRSTKKPCHRYFFFFFFNYCSFGLLPATEWCNKNIWLHTWFSQETVLKSQIFSSVSTSHNERLTKTLYFFGHKRTFLDNRSIDFVKKSNLFSPVVLVSRYTKQLLDYPISSMVLLSEQR